MNISTLLVPLNCTVNTVSIPNLEHDDTAHERNDRVRVKIGLPPLPQSETTLQLDTVFIRGLSFGQRIDNAVEIEDVEYKVVIYCEKSDISDTPRQQSKRK